MPDLVSDNRLRWVVVIAVALTVGFFIGTWRSGVRIETGRADSTADGGGSISTSGWTYGFAANVPWVDTGNTWHEGEIPDCLPPMSSVEGVRFGWIEATVEGATWRPVVWIDCRSVAQPVSSP